MNTEKIKCFISTQFSLCLAPAGIHWFTHFLNVTMETINRCDEFREKNGTRIQKVTAKEHIYTIYCWKRISENASRLGVDNDFWEARIPSTTLLLSFSVAAYSHWQRTKTAKQNSTQPPDTQSPMSNLHTCQQQWERWNHMFFVAHHSCHSVRQCFVLLFFFNENSGKTEIFT